MDLLFVNSIFVWLERPSLSLQDKPCNIYLISIIMRLTSTLRSCFAKYKEANHLLGEMGEEPNLKAKQLDKLRRFYTRANFHMACKEHPNFSQFAHDLLPV